jgi:hypothetical protein
MRTKLPRTVSQHSVMSKVHRILKIQHILEVDAQLEAIVENKFDVEEVYNTYAAKFRHREFARQCKILAHYLADSDLGLKLLGN